MSKAMRLVTGSVAETSPAERGEVAARAENALRRARVEVSGYDTVDLIELAGRPGAVIASTAGGRSVSIALPGGAGYLVKDRGVVRLFLSYCEENGIEVDHG